MENLVVGQKFLSYLEYSLIESWNLNIYYIRNCDVLIICAHLRKKLVHAWYCLK